MKPPKKSSSSNPSRISQLPADVICIILTFLPIKEAARTSILSREWRHLWKRMPQLVFDSNFATISRHHPDRHSESDNVMLNVNQALQVHDGPFNKFALAIPAMIHCPQLDQLIRYLSTKSVNELSLSFAASSPHISLPASLFALPNLSSLTLGWFIFETSNLSMGFSKLTFLELNVVQLPPDFFEKFLPNCPLLQELRVLECGINGNDPVFATSSLKVLHFNPCNPCTIRFIYTPHLSVLSALHTPYKENHYYYYMNGIRGEFKGDMVAVFGSLPALEQLNLSSHLLFFLTEANDVPCQLPALLHNLKVLEIPRLALARLKEARVLVCLIRSTPNLRKLTIGRDKYRGLEDPVGVEKLLEPEDKSGVCCCLQHLEEFSIRISRGNQVELKLVRFVLANAPILKRVFLKPTNDLSYFTMLKFIEEVTQCEWISKEVEVTLY